MNKYFINKLYLYQNIGFPWSDDYEYDDVMVIIVLTKLITTANVIDGASSKYL